MTGDEARALKPGLYRMEFVSWEDRGDPVIAEVSHDPLSGPGWLEFGDDFCYYGRDDWMGVARAVPLFVVPLENLTDFQALALAVLRGDENAIPALLDEAEARFHGRPSVEERIAAAIDEAFEEGRRDANFDRAMEESYRDD